MSGIFGGSYTLLLLWLRVEGLGFREFRVWGLLNPRPTPYSYLGTSQKVEKGLNPKPYILKEPVRDPCFLRSAGSASPRREGAGPTPLSV